MVLDPQRWLELRRFRSLRESGAIGLSEIARETGMDRKTVRKTVRKYLSAPGPATPPRRSPSGRRARVIDEFGPLIDSMLRAEVLMKPRSGGARVFAVASLATVGAFAAGPGAGWTVTHPGAASTATRSRGRGQQRM